MYPQSHLSRTNGNHAGCGTPRLFKPDRSFLGHPFGGAGLGGAGAARAESARELAQRSGVSVPGQARRYQPAHYAGVARGGPWAQPRVFPASAGADPRRPKLLAALHRQLILWPTTACEGDRRTRDQPDAVASRAGRGVYFIARPSALASPPHRRCAPPPRPCPHPCQKAAASTQARGLERVRAGRPMEGGRARERAGVPRRPRLPT